MNTLKCRNDIELNGSIKVLNVCIKAHPDVACWVGTMMFHLTGLEVGQRLRDYEIHNN